MADDLDERVGDMQATLHRIDGSMLALEARFTRTEARMGDLERDVIEVRAEQRGAEKVQSAENRLLHEKIDGIHRSQKEQNELLAAHLHQEDSDRQSMIQTQRSLLVKLAALFITGTGTVLFFLLGHQGGQL